MHALRRVPLALSIVALLAQAQSADSVRKEIETAYARALEAMRQAKSMADLDEIDRTFDNAGLAKYFSRPTTDELAESAKVSI